jgi:hypothetical protein
MDRKILWRLLTGCALTLALIATGVSAQTPYQPGDKIDYKIQNSPEQWESGVFVKELPGGKQVLIRQKPSQFFPEGFERAYALDEVRPAGNQAARAQVPGPKVLAEKQPNGINNQQAAAGIDGAPMSQQEVLSFLRERLGGGDPFMNPKREAALAELRLQILQRGVNFRYHAIGQFADELGKFGALSGVTAPLFENFGPPAKLEWLFGTWDSIKLGSPKKNTFFGKAGFLKISSNGTYEWSTASGVFKGQWRKATAEEMAKSDKAGEGLVLLKAKSAADWIVTKRDTENQGGEGVKISDVANLNTREYAWRR